MFNKWLKLANNYLKGMASKLDSFFDLLENKQPIKPSVNKKIQNLKKIKTILKIILKILSKKKKEKLKNW